MRNFVNGIVFTLAVLLAGTFVTVKTGIVYSGADRKPPELERLVARTSLHASIDRGAIGLTPTVRPDEKTLLSAVKLYANNCAVCHGAADGGPSNIAKGFYIGAPQLATDGVEDDPVSETFWKLKHGIRFTAMPAFGGALGDDQLWALSLFVAQMDKLPPVVDEAWKKVPSVASSVGPLTPLESGSGASATKAPGIARWPPAP